MIRLWEYKLVHLPSEGFNFQIEDLLNEYGSKGWELCGIEYAQFIFKRRKLEYTCDTCGEIIQEASYDSAISKTGNRDFCCETCYNQYVQSHGEIK